MDRRHAVRSLLAVGSLALFTPHQTARSAERYPNRPIKLIVPYAPGSPVDTQARKLSDPLAKALGQPIVVENRAGASGTIGVGIGAKARPDGYTLIVGSSSNLVVSPALGLSLPYDPLRDLDPVTQYSRGGAVLVAHPSLGVNTAQDFFALAKAKPGQLTYASSGATGVGHLAGELLQHEAGIKLLHVPYKTPAFMAVLGNEVPLGFDFGIVVAPHVRAGKLRALLVTARKRNTALPEVPTVAECGFPDAEIYGWSGILVPAGTPKEIVAHLHKEIVTVLATDAIREAFAGSELVGSTPEEFRATIAAEQARIARIVKLAGIKGEVSQ